MQLKPKQREDLARAALHDGLIFAWDTGLGKSLGSLLWACLKVGWRLDHNDRVMPHAAVLIVGPSDGFEHWQSEARIWQIELRRFETQEEFTRLCADGRSMPPAFYYTTYPQLTRNGVADFPPWTAMPGDTNEAKLAVHKEWSAGIDEFRCNIRCCYSASLADLCAAAFRCVIVDEAVRLKGSASLVGLGVRQLSPKYRLVVTATPIKNRLPDIFWLAWWAAGGSPTPSARFPYEGSVSDQRTLSESFLIEETNLTKEARAREAGRKTRYQKFTAQVCNVHGLWKLLAALVLRRRKADMDADIPPKLRHVIRVPMGRRQKEVYKYH